MKYLKYFEQKEVKKLWLIRTDSPYLEISIDKINLPQKQKDYLLNNDYVTGKRLYREDDKVIDLSKIYVPDSDEKYAYSWSPYNGHGLDIFTSLGFIYQGEVEVTEDELRSKKYNL